jgi:hypothetical protein
VREDAVDEFNTILLALDAREDPEAMRATVRLLREHARYQALAIAAQAYFDGNGDTMLRLSLQATSKPNTENLTSDEPAMQLFGPGEQL